MFSYDSIERDLSRYRQKQSPLALVWDKIWEGLNHYNGEWRFLKSVDKISYFESLGVNFSGKRVLDVGCGQGEMLFYLERKYNCQCYGLDISQTVVNTANANKISASSTCCFKIGDARDIPYEKEIFDIVISWGVVEHFSDYLKALTESNRVCRCGGCVLYIQPHLFSFGHFQRYWLKLRGKWSFGLQKDFAYSTFVKYLKAAGFDYIRIAIRAPYTDMPVVRLLDKIVGLVFRHWGHYLYCVAFKIER